MDRTLILEKKKKAKKKTNLTGTDSNRKRKTEYPADLGAMTSKGRVSPPHGPQNSPRAGADHRDSLSGSPEYWSFRGREGTYRCGSVSITFLPILYCAIYRQGPRN